MNCLKISGWKCGSRMWVGDPAAPDAMIEPGMRYASPRFTVWKLLHLKQLE